MFGEHLRQFRKRRGMSQLDLAVSANSTARYVSFIETGRSRPGREIVLRLAAALGLTLRESNQLLKSTGLRPEYEENDLCEDALTPARRVVESVLKNHCPYPAWSIGPGLRFLSSNEAAEKIFPGLVGLAPERIVDLFCSRSGGQEESQRKKNVQQMMAALRQEMLHYPHPDLPALLERAEGYAAGVDFSHVGHDAPFVFGTLPINGQTARTISTVMRFDKSNNVTVSEIRVELIFPADDQSDRLLREFYES